MVKHENHHFVTIMSSTLMSMLLCGPVLADNVKTTTDVSLMAQNVAYSKDQTTIVFDPSDAMVKQALNKVHDGGTVKSVILVTEGGQKVPMTDLNGIYTVTLKGDQKGLGYQFDVTFDDGKTVSINNPEANNDASSPYSVVSATKSDSTANVNVVGSNGNMLALKAARDGNSASSDSNNEQWVTMSGPIYYLNEADHSQKVGEVDNYQVSVAKDRINAYGDFVSDISRDALQAHCPSGYIVKSLARGSVQGSNKCELYVIVDPAPSKSSSASSSSSGSSAKPASSSSSAAPASSSSSNASVSVVSSSQTSKPTASNSSNASSTSSDAGKDVPVAISSESSAVSATSADSSTNSEASSSASSETPASSSSNSATNSSVNSSSASKEDSSTSSSNSSTKESEQSSIKSSSSSESASKASDASKSNDSSTKSSAKNSDSQSSKQAAGTVAINGHDGGNNGTDSNDGNGGQGERSDPADKAANDKDTEADSNNSSSSSSSSSSSQSTDNDSDDSGADTNSDSDSADSSSDASSSSASSLSQMPQTGEQSNSVVSSMMWGLGLASAGASGVVVLNRKKR